MRITHLKIENYRGLRDVESPISNFGCLIGENNAGKSSILQALALFFSGSAISQANFFDASKEIRIELTFRDISEDDLLRLADEHRTRIKSMVKDGSLVLIRVYYAEGKSTLKYRTLMPIEQRFNDTSIDALTKGKKPSPALAKEVINVFPELADKVSASSNLGEIRTCIQALADSLPDERKELVDAALKTGIDKSIDALFPEVIYIPAVKDLMDDIKIKESTPFGKLLNILLKAIEPQLTDAKQLFEKLDSKLNRVALDDGRIQDERLDEVKTIEKTVERFVQESFSNVTVKITIPPPQLKTVLSSAKIYANDGVEGEIETKGDGLRRAIVFAVLRSFVELNNHVNTVEASTNMASNRYLLLFEEPELYLHPKAQLFLFHTLNHFARQHGVIVTTHSPMFCGPGETATFVKLSKTIDRSISDKPFTSAHHVDLSDMKAKDQFQLICYDNNNAAFFSDTVVLVEGDSDYLVLPHLARTLNADWDFAKTSVCFARINGKTSIKRYKDFFIRFKTRVAVIADLDLLVSSFEQIQPSTELIELREKLMVCVDKTIQASSTHADLSSGQIKSAHGKGDLKLSWRKAKEAYHQFKDGRIGLDVVETAVDDFFAWERNDERLEVLQHSTDPSVLKLKRQLLAALRKCDVYVLEKGAIESYYPPTIFGADKPSKAQCFCNAITTRETALSLCSDQALAEDGSPCNEFELIFGAIFKNQKESHNLMNQQIV